MSDEEKQEDNDIEEIEESSVELAETGSGEVDLDDEVLLRLALEAHRKDITLNQLINESLKSFIEQGIEAQ